uniref:Uncharacterized protein n=1 Tax=Anopheles funestus TaxID=62324 RepID=A0A182RZN1_ANOFN
MEDDWNEAASDDEDEENYSNSGPENNMLQDAALKRRSAMPRDITFDMNLSVDGLPLHHSSAKEFWPILMQVSNMPEIPIMVLGIIFGLSKPNNVEGFIRPLVTEINHILLQANILSSTY